MSTTGDSHVTMVTSPEPSPPSTPASTTPSTPSTTSTTSTNTSSNTNITNYQIPNMNVYINKTTCRELNIIHHPHTETNIHPATLLARIHFNEAQLFYLRSHSAAYPIVTTLFALSQDDWFECRIYPYPNGIPPMMMPPPPITTPLVTTPTSTTPSTPTLNIPPIPIPTPLVHSSSLHSLFMNQTASPIDSKFSNKSNIHSPLPLINLHDHWYLRQNNSPVTTSSASPITSTPSSLSSSPSVNTFPAFLQHDVGSTTTLSQFPYTTTTPPTNINIQHIQYQIPQQPTKPTITTSSRKRKSSTSNTNGVIKKHKDKKRATRSNTRKGEGHEDEEQEEEESELSTPSDIEEEEEDDSRPSSPDPLALPTSDAELFKRKKVLKKVYKKRYQQKKSIKRKIARFHATGDKAVVIFVTRNSQRKFGYDVEFYNPISSSNDFMNRFWREQQSLVESYLQHHYTNKHRNNNNNEVREEEENHHYDNNQYPNSKYQGTSVEVGVPSHYTAIESNA